MESLVITGGSGLLGRSLIERLYGEVRITALSRSEKSQLALRRRWPGVQWALGDVQDGEALYRACAGADTLVHAAALKHVDLSEREPTEYAQVNVIGSLVAASVASVCGLRAVGISTDKSCVPRNVYGLTKLLMERIFCEQGHVCVRYGNVFGSDGSVLDVWGRQLQEAGKIRVTDPEMTRFYFPIEDAVEEVLWALGNAPAGTVVVPQLRSARLIDLATAFTNRYGGEIEIVGPRAGEKRHESLLSEEEGSRAEAVGQRVILHPFKATGKALAPISSETVERLSVEELDAWLGTHRRAA